MRCLYDGQEGLKHGREYGYRHELDMETLVCARPGALFQSHALQSAYGARAAAVAA